MDARDIERLRTVEDRQAITDLIYRYCRAMDRIDHALGYSIWHADGTADYGADVWQGSGHGFVDHVCAQHAQMLAHSHQVTNVIIDLDGDRAGSESYVTATLRYVREGQLMQIGVWNRYVDRWSKRAGRWGIDHRITVIDYDEIRPVTAMRRTTIATRDRTDPSYAVLRDPA